MTRGEFSTQTEGTTIASTWSKTSRTISWLRYSGSHSTRAPASVGERVGEGLQGGGLLAARAAPDPQASVALHAAEGLDELVDALRGDVRADVSEGEGLVRAAAATYQAGAVEAVVEVDELARREAEFLAIAALEVASRGDEEVDVLDHGSHVLHASADPVGPVRDVTLALVVGAREVAGVAALGALAVVLTVAGGPQIIRVLGVHLHELPAGTHHPVVVQGVDDRDLAAGGLENQRRGEVVEVADVDDVGLDLIEQGLEGLIDAGLR
jgi:hypothetical protein